MERRTSGVVLISAAYSFPGCSANIFLLEELRGPLLRDGDVVLDESSCIVLAHATDLLTHGGMPALLQRIQTVSAAFSCCYLIIEAATASFDQQ